MPGIGRFYSKYGERQFWSHVNSRISQKIIGLEVWNQFSVTYMIVTEIGQKNLHLHTILQFRDGQIKENI